MISRMTYTHLEYGR